MKNYDSIIEFDKFKANFSLHLTLGCHCPEGDSNVIHMRSLIKMICLSGITWFSDCEGCHHIFELPRVWDLDYDRKFVLKLRKMAFLSQREDPPCNPFSNTPLGRSLKLSHPQFSHLYDKKQNSKLLQGTVMKSKVDNVF